MTLSHSVVLTDDGFAAAKQVFDALDTDKDGNLDRSDFGHVGDVARSGGVPGSNPMLAKLGDQIMALDTNADGVVRSFVHAVTRTTRFSCSLSTMSLRAMR